MATVPVRLRRWGNSLAAIIPADVAREEQLREGDVVVLDIARRSSARAAFALLARNTVDAQAMKDEDRNAW